MTGQTLAELSESLANGRTTSRDLTEECLAAATDQQGQGATVFIELDADGARAAADASDARRRDGKALSPLDGLVIAIKDLFDVEGQVTRAGSTVLDGSAPARSDAEAVAKLRAAGMVLIGRTNMTEFAFSGLGLNPHYGTPISHWRRDERHIAGGSTSGGSASVADGMAHAALGTDTGGSCRIPAAFNGLTGFKPTARRTSLQGTIPLSTTLDTVGTIGRSVECCRLLDSVLAGGKRTAARPVAGLRVLAVANYVRGSIQPEVADRFDRVLAALSAQGASVSEVQIPEFDRVSELAAKGGISAAESYAWHQRNIGGRASEYDPRVWIRIARGAEQSAEDYADILGLRAEFVASIRAYLDRFDVLAMPTVPILPPTISELSSDEEYTPLNLLALRNPALVNLFDGCAISLPIGGFEAPPVGFTLACATDADAHLLACAAAVERTVHALQ